VVIIDRDDRNFHEEARQRWKKPSPESGSQELEKVVQALTLHFNTVEVHA